MTSGTLASLPSGTVTFLLSDVQASSQLWQRDAATADDAFAQLDALVEDAVAGLGGIVLKARGEGDSHFTVFDRASTAVASAVRLQRLIATAEWPPHASIAIRVGVHTGEPLLRDGDYFGSVVNETARLRGLGHGGQVLASPVTAMLARPALDDDIDFISLGVFRIRDFRQPQEVFQVTAPGLATDFPPLQALDTMPPPIAAVVRLDLAGSGRVLETKDYSTVMDSVRSFHRLVRGRFDACGGYALHLDADSVTAAFGTPVMAVEFVRQLAARVQLAGFALRAGVHVGGVEVTPNGPQGVPVLVAEGLVPLATPGEIVVTRAVAELLEGSSVGAVPGPDTSALILGRTWELYTVTAT